MKISLNLVEQAAPPQWLSSVRQLLSKQADTAALMEQSGGNKTI